MYPNTNTCTSLQGFGKIVQWQFQQLLFGDVRVVITLGHTLVQRIGSRNLISTVLPREAWRLWECLTRWGEDKEQGCGFRGWIRRRMCSLWSVAIAIPAGSRSPRKSWVYLVQLVGLDPQVSQGQSALCLWSALFEKRRSQCWCFWDAVWAQVAISPSGQWAWKGGDSHYAAVDVLALSRSENIGFSRSQAFICNDWDIRLAWAGQDTAQKISSGKWPHRWTLWEGNVFFPKNHPWFLFCLVTAVETVWASVKSLMSPRLAGASWPRGLVATRSTSHVSESTARVSHTQCEWMGVLNMWGWCKHLWLSTSLSLTVGFGAVLLPFF